MCELLAQEMTYNYRETFFLVGLFSVLDALMDMPMTEIVASLPLDDMIVQALLHHEGALGLTLRSVLAYERENLERPDLMEALGTVIREIAEGAAPDQDEVEVPAL